MRTRTSSLIGLAKVRCFKGFALFLLYTFVQTAAASRKTADVAILLVSKVINGTCGIAYTDVNGQASSSYGLVMNTCFDGTTGHEVGHLFGAYHNREIEAGPDTPRGGKAYGYLMRKPDGTPSGFHSIMA